MLFAPVFPTEQFCLFKKLEKNESYPLSKLLRKKYNSYPGQENLFHAELNICLQRWYEYAVHISNLLEVYKYH